MSRRHFLDRFGFGNKGKKHGTNKTVSYSPPKITKPTDTYSNEKLAIAFFDQSILNDIKERCIDKAKESEFQVHYRGLIVHIVKDNFEVAVSIPTAFYNFDQKVGLSSVNYDLQEVEEASDEVKEISKENVQKNLEQLKIFKDIESAGFSVRFEEGDFGSIHRHPGRFGFSSIDKRNNPIDSGVIYRKKEATNFFQNDSVMYIGNRSSNTEIYTTECRVLNLNGVEDGGTAGTYCSIPTLTVVRPDTKRFSSVADPVEKVLGSVEDDIFSRFEITTSGGAKNKKYPFLEAILMLIEHMNYNCDISNVSSDKISQGYSNYAYGGYNYPGVAQSYKKQDYKKQDYKKQGRKKQSLESDTRDYLIEHIVGMSGYDPDEAELADIIKASDDLSLESLSEFVDYAEEWTGHKYALNPEEWEDYMSAL